MTHRNNIEIDYCPSCRGVWLDKGELDKMLDFAERQTNSFPENRPYSQDDGRGRYSDKHYGTGKPPKKKSFLSDFFDFD